MDEEERAKRLSDVIDSVLKGGQPELDLDDDELIELLRIARLRHRAGQAGADIGRASQNVLWRVLRARMVARHAEQETERQSHPGKRTAP